MKTLHGFVISGLLLMGSWAHALDMVPYSAKALADAQKTDKPVAVHFHADWCPTCRAQTKVLTGMLPDKTLNMTVLVADYDTEKALKQRMGVRMQSTLIVFRGMQEKARLVGDTTEPAIRRALKAAL